MSDSSRRGFLKVAGTGAAVAGVAVVIPSVSAADAAPVTPAAPELPASATGALVAYVTDVKSGTLALMVEGHEVTVTDHELVARLAQAMHKASLAKHATLSRSV